MKNLILLSATFVLLTACQQRGSNPSAFTLTGKLTGLDNDTIYLLEPGENETRIDTTVAKKGSFSFTGICKEPKIYYLQYRNNSYRQMSKFYHKEVFLEPGIITVSGNRDSIETVQLSGSSLQKKYEEFKARVKPFEYEIDSLSAAYEKLEGIKDSEAQALLVYRAIAGPDEGMKNETHQFISENTGSLVSPYIILRVFDEPGLGEVDSLFSSLDSTVKVGYYGRQLNELVRSLKITAIGAPAPDFTLNDTSGNPICLSSYKNKVVLIDFWASWCGPCRQENPNVVKAYQKYHPKGLEILGVSLDEKRPKWVAAIEKDNLSWQHVSDLKGWANAASHLYGVRGIPANYLVGKNGTILAKDLRGEALEKKLAEVLK